jgi:hypothetical protein
MRKITQTDGPCRCSLSFDARVRETDLSQESGDAELPACSDEGRFGLADRFGEKPCKSMCTSRETLLASLDCTGAVEGDYMHALFAHSAFWRGMSVFAGMLMGKVVWDAEPSAAMTREDELVSWWGGARSRREDELARSRQTDMN